jgi:uncharacterized protein YjbI with pentapeptide repeats
VEKALILESKKVLKKYFINYQPIKMTDREPKSVETQMNLGASVNGAAGKVEGNQIINVYNNGKVPSLSTQQETKRFAFAIAGTADGVDRAKLNIIAALLRKISGDSSVEIIDVDEGSIKIILKSSGKGLSRIQALFESGELTEVDGCLVEYVRSLSEAENQKIVAKSQLVQNIVAPTVERKSLKGTDLSGANLRWADLSYADLSGAKLRWADLRGANLRWGNLNKADLRGADLRKTDLRGSNLRGSDLRGANMGGAILDNANLSAATLSDANSENTIPLESKPLSASSAGTLSDAANLEDTTPSKNIEVSIPEKTTPLKRKLLDLDRLDVASTNVASKRVGERRKSFFYTLTFFLSVILTLLFSQMFSYQYMMLTPTPSSSPFIEINRIKKGLKESKRYAQKAENLAQSPKNITDFRDARENWYKAIQILVPATFSLPDDDDLVIEAKTRIFSYLSHLFKLDQRILSKAQTIAQQANQDLEEFGKDGTKKISSLNQIENQFKEALKYIEIVSFDAPYHFSIDETRKSSKSYQEKLQQINNKIAQIRQKCPTGDGIGKSGKCLP